MVLASRHTEALLQQAIQPCLCSTWDKIFPNNKLQDSASADMDLLITITVFALHHKALVPGDCKG